MVRFFHFTDEQVLSMPASRFFALSGQIPKLQAQETLREINVITSAVSGGDSAERFVAKLQELAGVKRPKADPASFGIEVIRNGV